MKTRLITIGGYVLAIIVMVGLTWWWSNQVNILNQKIAVLSKKEATASSTPTLPLSYYEEMVRNVLGDIKAEDVSSGFNKNAQYYQSQYVGDQNGIFTPDNRPADIDYLSIEFAKNGTCIIPFENEVVKQYNSCMSNPSYVGNLITPYASIELLDSDCLSQAVAQSIEDGACGN